MEASSMHVTGPAQSAEARQARQEIARWWWAWLVSGILWILAAVVILQFKHTSVALVGIIVGVMFLVAGAEEFVAAYLTSDWRWLRLAFGIILFAGGLFALFNPVGTFLAVADLLGFLFALVGIFWMIDAFATRAGNELWWLGLIAGFFMIGLGFWAAGQFLATQAFTLLIFAGIWALLHGITDIIKSFTIRSLGTVMVAQPEPAP